ncbi:hypothetical protein LCGC14_1038830 [marine sediment metagenome]|uniref:Uncharacterized protein n=1 Tax=marine sediment metagenome TaxID=412755 RepID=A0A0F9NE30_9ZZZZ
MTKQERETKIVKIWLQAFKLRIAFANLAITHLLIKIQMRKEMEKLNAINKYQKHYIKHMYNIRTLGGLLK